MGPGEPQVLNRDPGAAPDARVSDQCAMSEALPHWTPRSSLLKLRSYALLAISDCLALFLPFVLVAWARGSTSSESSWLTYAAALLPVYLLLAANRNAYAPIHLQDPFRAIRQGLESLLLATSAMILGVFYSRAGLAFPRLTIALSTALAAGTLAASRYYFVRHLSEIVGGNPFSVILIVDRGQPAPAGQFSAVIDADGMFDPDSDDPIMYDRLAKSLETADRVVIACPPDRRVAWARALRGANIQGEIDLPELAPLAAVGLGPNRGSPSVIVAVGPLSFFDRALKRGFDFTLAVIAIILLSPILLGLALWIRYDSPGPAIFRQTRIGRGNQLFSMRKFRSMRVQEGDDAGHRSTARDDDRITRAGQLMRRTSLDELPQLFNVLAGSMSIVGPRPHALGSRAADKLFWEVDDRYWDRHAAKPGLTGLAQIRGFRGATDAEDDLRNRLNADLEYLENWSIWRDIKIIFLTLRVLVHRNAF